MKRPLRLGIVGVGSVGQRGVLDYTVSNTYAEWVEVVALCDSSAERAKAAATKYSVPRHFHNLASMLSSCDLDAVSICTPIAFHYSQRHGCDPGAETRSFQ